MHVVDAGAFEVRPLSLDESPDAVATLQAAFREWPSDMEGGNPLEHFRWKHLECPLGQSLMFVAEADARVVGFAAWLPCTFAAGGKTIEARRSVDLAVRPEYRGRGVAAALATAGGEHAPAGTAFTFSNPNSLSMSGVLRLGRRRVGVLPKLVRFLSPLRAVRSRRADFARVLAAISIDAPRVSVALADEQRVSALLSEVRVQEHRLSPIKDVAYLRWRYGVQGEYHARLLETGGRLAGLAIFRLRRHRASWNIRVCELFVAGDDRWHARRLLKDVLGAADVDYATCVFATDTVQRSAARRCGFVGLRRGETLVVYPLRSDIDPDPTDLHSWALTLGDLELL